MEAINRLTDRQIKKHVCLDSDASEDKLAATLVLGRLHSEVVLLDKFLETDRPPFGLLFRVLGYHVAL